MKVIIIKAQGSCEDLASSMIESRHSNSNEVSILSPDNKNGVDKYLLLVFFSND